MADILGAVVERDALPWVPRRATSAPPSARPSAAAASRRTGTCREALRAYLGADAEAYIAPGAREGKYLVDLRGANARRLTQLGVPEGNIAVSGECTVCSHEKYWSHRHVCGGARGSQCGVITL